MGTVSKISTAEESRIIGGVPSPTDFPEREEDYNWRTSKINISGNRELVSVQYVISRIHEDIIRIGTNQAAKANVHLLFLQNTTYDAMLES